MTSVHVTPTTSTTSTGPPGNNEVCKVDDDFVRDKFRWVAVLANGETIYEDDGRPGLDEPSAWKRLKMYCKGHKTYIIELWLQFRSNRVQVQPTHADGYYLVKCVFGFWGEVSTHHAYIVGALVDGKIHASKWQSPDLTLLESSTRIPDYESPSLICRNT
jgi:hypothetical protein